MLENKQHTSSTPFLSRPSHHAFFSLRSLQSLSVEALRVEPASAP